MQASAMQAARRPKIVPWSGVPYAVHHWKNGPGAQRKDEIAMMEEQHHHEQAPPDPGRLPTVRLNYTHLNETSESFGRSYIVTHLAAAGSQLCRFSTSRAVFTLPFDTKAATNCFSEVIRSTSRLCSFADQYLQQSPPPILILHATKPCPLVSVE